MRTKGKIASWNDDRGYGFIAPSGGGKQIFVHVNAFSNRQRRPLVNDVVTYSTSNDRQGRLRAVNATLAGDKLVKTTPKKNRKVSIVFAVLFLLMIGVSVLAWQLPAIVLTAYIVLSVITFIAYALDKSAAQRGDWRTGERTLLMLGLIGGWPGALIAQETLRHKSKKYSFRTAFWGTVLLNCAAIAWLHTESGRALLQRLFL